MPSNHTFSSKRTATKRQVQEASNSDTNNDDNNRKPRVSVSAKTQNSRAMAAVLNSIQRHSPAAFSFYYHTVVNSVRNNTPA